MYIHTKKYAACALAAAVFSMGNLAYAMETDGESLTKDRSAVEKDGEALSEYDLPLFYVYGYRLPKSAQVGAKMQQDIKDIPASVTIVDQAEMERLGVYNITDALEYNAGITVAPYGYHPLHTMSKIRGFDLDNTNLIVDGMKQFSTTSQVQSPELYGIEQVEILRGPSSLYGAGSIGGTVNLRMKEPHDKRAGEIQLQAGTQNEKFVAFDLNSGKTKGNISARLVGMYRGQDLFYDDSKDRRFYFAPSFKQEFSGKTTLLIKPFYQQDKIDGNSYFARTKLPGDPLYGVLPDRFFVGVKGFDTYELKQKGISYEVTHKVNDNISLYQKGSYRDANIVSHQTTGIFYPGPGMFFRWGAMIDNEVRSYGLDQSISIKHGTKHRGGQTVFGFDMHYENEWEKDRMRQLNPWTLTDLKDYATGKKPIPEDPESIMEMGELSYWNKEQGIYLQHTEKFDHLTLNGAVRKGFYKEHSDRDNYEEKESAFTGQIGAVYNAGKDLYPYVHWHNSFEPALHLDENNSLLKPTRGNELELGIKYLPETSATQVNLSFFNLKRQNVHVPVAGTTYFQAIGEMCSKGIELEYRSALTDTLSILGSYSYLDSKITQDSDPKRIGRHPRGAAMHTFTARIDKILKKYKDGEVIVGLGMRYLGRRFNDTNDIALGGVALYDASLRINKGNDSFNLHVRNLFDKKYMMSIENLWGVPTGFAGQDRTWILSYIHKF